ncbi:MAG TPA: RHS repeat-associated core domain-containing protein, partial [Bryobacteraceae bacterium]|nr:RHS repeat-associated core domain-containing protein [Bryobacteraceae bacterium]
SGLVLDSHLVPSPVAFSRSQTAHGYRTWPGTASSNARYPQHNHARYDPFGNIAKADTISFQPTYNAATNRYSTLPAGTPAYDANGYVNADGFHVYSYDVEGKITQIDSGAVTMTYDALGRWVERGAGGGFTQRVFSPSGREFSLTSGQTVATAYVPLPGGALARYENGLDSYWHPDWLGTARLYSTPSRTVAFDVAFGPFGEWYVNGPADSFFTGVAQSDAAADMKAFPARDYHTTQGRWLIPDPAGIDAVDLANPQTLNRYAYVMNDPLANVDPTGMAPGTTITIQIPTHCYQTEMTGLPGEWPVCEFMLQQISVGPTNIPGDPGGHPNGPGQAPPNNGIGIRAPGQTFKACMAQHASEYSLGGLVDTSYGLTTGKDSSLSTNPLASFVLGNSINTLLFGSGDEAASAALSNAPSAMTGGMGNALTYGRRTSDIMALNLAGRGGLPVALGRSSAGVKAAIGKAGSFLSLGLSFAERMGLDIAFSGAEAVDCSMTF